MGVNSGLKVNGVYFGLGVSPGPPISHNTHATNPTLHSCGYRNIQMLASSLLTRRLYREVLFGGAGLTMVVIGVVAAYQGRSPTKPKARAPARRAERQRAANARRQDMARARRRKK